MKRIVICLVFVLLFVGIVDAQTKSMTGIVTYYSVGNKGNWAGIDVEVGNKKYYVSVFGVDISTTKIVGTIDEVGRVVRVYYTKIVRLQGYDGELKATKIIEVKKSKSPKKK